jgi:hypothetical protein
LIDSIEKIKREIVLKKLEQKTYITFSEASLIMIHKVLDLTKDSVEDSKILSSFEVSPTTKEILKQAIFIYREEK